MRWSNRSGHNTGNICKKLEVYWNTRTIALSKGEGRFIEDDVPRDDDSVGGEVKATVPFMMS